MLGYLISGAMRRRRQAQRRVMQWCVERRMGVLVKGGFWRMDCWVCIVDVVVDGGDMGGDEA